MSNTINKLYEFSSFRFDTESKTLWHEEEMVLLPPKALDVLSLLIEKEGKIVSKQEILNTVWVDTFVEEGVLTQNIYKLRNALGTDENGKQFIENIPRRGYRLTVPVKVLKSEEVSVLVAEKTDIAFSDELSVGAFSEKNNTELIESNEFDPSFKPLISETKSKAQSNIPRPLFIILGIFILFLLVFGIYQFINQNKKPEIAPIEQLKFQRLTDTGDITFLSISPNGEWLGFIRQEEEGESIWIKQIATGSSSRILPPQPRGYRMLAFSPDNRYLFIRETANPGAIFQISAISGGTTRKVADNVWSNFSISPDGKRLAFIRRDLTRNAYLLILSNIDGSGEIELNMRNAPPFYVNAFSWSPDGAKILITTSSADILMVDISNGKEEKLQMQSKSVRWRAVSGAVWMPDGKNLLISARDANESFSQLWVYSQESGEIRRLTNDLEGYFSISLSSDGKKLIARQQKIIARIWVLPNGDLKNAKQLTFDERKLDGFSGLTYFPEDKLLFSHFSDSENITNLYKINSDGTNRIQLTLNAGQDNGYPSVSKDGRYIVFTSNRNGKRQIWRMDNDGRNQKLLTPNNDGNSEFAAVSPIDNEVFFIKRGAGAAAIWKVSIDGENPTQISKLKNAAAESYLSISPNGKWMAFQHISDKTESRDEERNVIVGVLPTDGNAEPKLFELPVRRRIIQWKADSTGFYFIGGTVNSSSIWIQSLEGGEPQKIVEFPDRIFNFAWSSDEKYLFVSRGKQQGDALLITNLPFAEKK